MQGAEQAALQRVHRGEVRALRRDARQPEVDHLGLAARQHEHVRRLDVAVHDPLAMGVVDGAADPREQAQVLCEGAVAALRVVLQRLPVDQLHREVGLGPAGGLVRARLVDARDALVMQSSQGLGLVAEAAQGVRGERPRPYDLERHLFVLVVPLGAVDDSHAPLAEHVEDAIRADPVGLIPSAGGLIFGHAEQIEGFGGVL